VLAWGADPSATHHDKVQLGAGWRLDWGWELRPALNGRSGVVRGRVRSRGLSLAVWRGGVLTFLPEPGDWRTGASKEVLVLRPELYDPTLIVPLIGSKA